IEKAIGAAGELLNRDVARAQDSDNVVDSKVRLQVTVLDVANVAAKETTVMTMAARDVVTGYEKLREAVKAAKGRMIVAKLNEEDRQNITADVHFEISRAQREALAKALAETGVVLTRNVTRAPDRDTVVETKERVQLHLMDVAK